MCFQDWCAAQMAKKLGKTDDYEEFMRRSTGWKNLFNGRSLDGWRAGRWAFSWGSTPSALGRPP